MALKIVDPAVISKTERLCLIIVGTEGAAFGNYVLSDCASAYGTSVKRRE